MAKRKTVSREEWLEARREFMQREKAFTKERDALAEARRDLPRVKVTKDYTFESESGPLSLSDLFEGRSQLIIYHFMYGEDWEEGCPSCSFWADGYNGILPHLKARDISLAAASNGPLDKLLSYRKRMGWSFPWVSSLGSDFNYDFAVSFREEELPPKKPNYNFDVGTFNGKEAPGMSVFLKDGGDIYHTYAAFARGLDIFNPAYHYMDAAPKGRDEDGLPFPMAWVKRHDQY